MKSILDPAFRYTKSADTDLRKTFARIRREQRRNAQQLRSDGDDVRRVLSLRLPKRAAV